MSSSTTSRRQGLSGNAAIKTPCYLATTANITLSGEQTIDGVTTSASRVLVKNQTTGADNGIYVSDSGTWERDLDFDGSYDARCGTLIFVTNGSANGAGLFQLTTADPITIGTTSLTFVKIATLAASAVTQAMVQNGQFVTLTSVAGTNTITGNTVGTAPSANGVGQYIFFVPANTNTGAATLARDGLTALNIFFNGAALIGGELVQNIPALVYEDGTQYQLVATAWNGLNFQTAGSVSAASTLVLNTAKPYTQVTGNTGITAITLGSGRIRFVEFTGTPTITYGASLILPNGTSDIVVAAGDTACFVGEGSGVVRCLFYQRKAGATSTQPTRQVFTSGSSATYTTPAGATRINVRLVGGGGGGAASATNSGTDGNDTTFSTLTGSGGKKGVTAAGAGGAGGAASGGDINIPGGAGGCGEANTAGDVKGGGIGGSTVFGGAGAAAKAAAGGNAATNSGAGGAGGGSTDSANTGGGGGAGGYVEKLITSPAATYTYTVGAAANGGAAGTNAGGNGAAGIIVVDEFYN